MTASKIKVKTVPMQIPVMLLPDFRAAAMEAGQTLSAFAVSAMQERAKVINAKFDEIDPEREEYESAARHREDYKHPDNR